MLVPLLFKIRLAVGIILFLAGLLYDWLRVAPRLNTVFQADPFPHLNSWQRHAQAEVRFYLVALGLLNIAVAALSLHGAPLVIAWASLLLMILGCLLFFAAMVRAVAAGPAKNWNARRFALAAGLLAILLSLCLDPIRYLFV